MIAGCTLSCYLRLVDAASRVLRDGKTSLAPELAPIFQRLDVNQEAWQATFSKLLTRQGRIPSRLASRARPPGTFQARIRSRVRNAGHPPGYAPEPVRLLHGA